jgi:hypothetical protein
MSGQEELRQLPALFLKLMAQVVDIRDFTKNGIGENEVALVIGFWILKHMIPENKATMRQIEGAIANCRRQFASNSLEITPDQQIKLPEKAIVLFTRLADNLRGLRTALEDIENLEESLPHIELPQFLALCMSWQNLSQNAEELFHALREYGNVSMEDADKMREQGESVIRQGISLGFSDYPRIAELYHEIEQELPAKLSASKAAKAAANPEAGTPSPSDQPS